MSNIKNLDKCDMPSGKVIVSYKTFSGWNKECEHEKKNVVGEWRANSVGDPKNPNSTASVGISCPGWGISVQRSRADVEKMYDHDMKIINEVFHEAARNHPQEIEIFEIRPFIDG